MVDKDTTLSNLSNEELAQNYLDMKRLSDEFSDSSRLIKIEILKRIHTTGTDGLPTQGFNISRKASTYQYDIDNLYAQLGEILSPDELNELFITIPSKVKVDGRIARSLITKYKGKVEKIIEQNRDSLNPVLKVELKK